MRKSITIILLFTISALCSSFVSTNVALNHFSYEAIDKLIGQGLIDSAMVTTKPFSRLEMARLITEAIEKAEALEEKNEIILSLIDRLKAEFRDELITIGTLDEAPVTGFIKPVEDPYIKYVFAEKTPDLENQRGDIFDKHSNYRFGFYSRMKFFDSLAFCFHPEYVDSSSDPDRNVELIEGYGKGSLGNLEIELGKDSLWWGPGYYGSMIMSNNAEPFKMVKLSNPGPIQLPWIFRSLGPFKAVWFLTELEDDRTVPEAKLTGLRLNFKPHPAWEIGLSKVIMFGGSGRANVSLKDYLNMFRPQSEQPENNKLAGFDTSVLLALNHRYAKSIKLYADFAGEDEAGGLPAKWGRLFGIQLNDILRTGRTDFRLEYANNHISNKPNVFYTHHIYQSGYTYKGRIIGHHMGTDSRDIFIRLTHYLKKDLIVGLEFDREVTGLSSSPEQAINKLGCDLTFFTAKNWKIKTGYRYERSKNTGFVSGRTEDNHIFGLQLTYNF
ncbi:MAG: capsule assembly Wzi family protein [Sedimentisphaerales bacterium]|nr:capsule assembly Wzi family protein [Sedimentisphaerales bacterium]